jgi:hypothetical protein
MKGLDAYSWHELAFNGATVAVVVSAVRFIWMFPAAYIPRKLSPSIGRKDPMPCMLHKKSRRSTWRSKLDVNVGPNALSAVCKARQG